MSLERKSSQSPQSTSPNDRIQSPSPTGLRHRPASRTATFRVKENDLSRRPSFFSEGLSETHKSFRASTDDLLLPRVKIASSGDDEIEISHWHSVPLGLALLPAVGGLLFKDGSHVVTDITLLGLAAIFLNWALRLPWEWYKSAQSTMPLDEDPRTSFSPIDEEEEDDRDSRTDKARPDRQGTLPEIRSGVDFELSEDDEILAAQQELRLHQLLALSACFLFPALGAWLLHAIRSQLSRPSEGLVSNYNLTIFLLVSELRPLSHTIKLVQKRTLFLQKKVNTRVLQEQQIEERQDVSEITKRLEELESHVATAALAPPAEHATSSISQDTLVAQAATQASKDLRKAFQPELDALNRAMRRYEKRMTITAIQVESRLQDLETRLKDVVVLAAAAQRSADKQPRNYITTLTNWLCGIIVVPTQYLYRVVSLPGKMLQSGLNWVKSILGLRRRVEVKDGKSTQRNSAPRAKASQKKGKATI